MVDAAATIDLTACGAAGNVNLTGKKLTKLLLSAPSTNANAITVATGGTDGYAIVTGFSVTLLASQSTEVEPGSSAPTVGPSALSFGVSGTGAQKVNVYIEAA